MTEDLERAIEPFLRLAESPIAQKAWINDDAWHGIYIRTHYGDCAEIRVEDLVELRRAWINAKRERQ